MRTKLNKDETPEKKVGNYFTEQKPLEFISSGCTLLDCVLGGGYPVGRIVNIVGDKSTGKTGMVIEACINFLKKYPEGKIWYLEAESAFDKGYAQKLGLPVDNIYFVMEELQEEEESKKIKKGLKADQTVETLFEHLDYLCGEGNEDFTQGLYVVDSLDALSDRSEQEREIDGSSYGTKKAAKMSELFRRLVSKLEKKGITLIVVSQVRDNIGVTFGAKHTRSGGKALDFYATQILWLAELKKHKKTVDKIENIVGLQIKANCKKNKISAPYRTCEYPLMTFYGIDDITAGVEWLEEIGKLSDLGEDGTKASTIINKVMKSTKEEIQAFRTKMNHVVRDNWDRIESNFLPVNSKY